MLTACGALLRGHTDPFHNGFWLTIDTTKAGSADNTFILPTNNTGTYNYQINWGDGVSEEHTTNTSKTHVYSNRGIYTIKIRGTFPQVYFMGSQDSAKVLSIQIGNVGWATLQNAFRNCVNLIKIADYADLSNVTDISGAWYNCTGLTSFPILDISNVTTIEQSWRSCSNLINFPSLNFASTTIAANAWTGCSQLVTFGAMQNTGSIGDFSYAWQDCSKLTIFPVIDTSSAVTLDGAWMRCSTLTSFPLIDTSNCESAISTWYNCTGLNGYNFPTLNLRKMSSGWECFYGTTLSTVSYSNLLIDMALGAVTGGTLEAPLCYYNAGAVSARNTLVSTRGWTIVDLGLI